MGEVRGREKQLVQSESGDWCMFELSLLHITALLLFGPVLCEFDHRLS